MDKNTFKAARDATATDYYSIFIVVSCFGGQKWKRDFAYSSRIKEIDRQGSLHSRLIPAGSEATPGDQFL